MKKKTLKILVVATKSWGRDVEAAYLKEAKEIMMAGNSFEDVVIDIEYQTFSKPETYVDNEGRNRITHDWFEKNISNTAKMRGYTSSRLRFEETEGRKWNLDSGIRGTNYRDNPNDFHGEGWIRSSKGKQATFKDGTKRNQWPKTLAHEEGHELKYAGLTDLEIHDFDFRGDINKIEDFYIQLVLKDNTKTVIIQLMSLVKKLVQKLEVELASRAVYPVPREEFFPNITQRWLEANSVYSSKYHNGLDFRREIGGAIYAPHNLTIYLSGETPQLGNFIFCEVVIGDRKTYHVFPHLLHKPKMGVYTKGDIIGYVGNTGLSFGAHVHWGILRVQPMNVSHYVSLVNTKDKIIKNTIDPYVWARYEVDRLT